MEIINEASEKFRDMQDEVCEFLFGILRQLNELESDVYERSEELKKDRPEPHIMAPGEDELWDEYGERVKEILKPCCTEKLLTRGYGMSFSKHGKYSYIDGDCRVNFIMKSAKKAVVETHFNNGIDKQNKFVIINKDGKWFLDEFYYGFAIKPDKWHISNIN